MSLFDFYLEEGFKLFKCGFNKAPDIPKGTDWRDPVNHLTSEQAEKMAVSGHLIGAWIPEGMIIIDIDNHVGKDNGLEYIMKLKETLGISYNLSKNTFVVKTGGGGYHLYYYADKDKAPAKLTNGVDIKTHGGYVIAAGSPGYKAANDNDPSDLPEELSLYIENKVGERKIRQEKHAPKRPLPVKMLRSILGKLDVKNFNTNDKWLEFCMAAIATCGNGDDIIDELVEWSYNDNKYSTDGGIKSRLESIDPAGGVTAATFLFILRKENCSEYMISRVSETINGGMDADEYIEARETIKKEGITVDPKITEFIPTAKFFNMMTNRDAASVLSECLKDKVIFVSGEHMYYIFKHGKWEPFYDIFNVTSVILEEVATRYYSDVAKESDDTAAEQYKKIIIKLGETKYRRDVLVDFCQREDIHRKAIKWDSPENHETLTIIDGVLDFRGPKMEIRHGRQNEYRRSFMPYKMSDFVSPKMPEAFDEFMTSTFPDRPTKMTALYALSLFVSGISSYRLFQVWHGGGRNGKSTLMEIMKKILGERAITYDTKLLLASKTNQGVGLTPELATMQGSLVAFGSETEERKKISTGLVKHMTGGDTIKANPKHRDPIEFESTWQLVLSTNDLPFFSSSDKAFIDRLLLLPFKVKFARTEAEYKKYLDNGEMAGMGKDGEQLKRDVEKEATDIIAMLIKKYIKLRDELNGTVPMSEACEQKKKLYVEDNDDIEPFIDHICEIDHTGSKGFFTPSTDITNEFKEFTGNYRATATYVVPSILKIKRDVVKGVAWIIDEGGKKKQARGLKNIRLKSMTEQSGEVE